jgi:hypothetical protein
LFTARCLETLWPSTLHYICHATCDHRNAVLHKSLPSVIQKLQPFELLRQNLCNAWIPALPSMTLGMYIMPQ